MRGATQDLLLTDTPREVERYEQFETAAQLEAAALADQDAWDVTRRDFFRITGGGLVVALLLSRTSLAQETGQPRNRGGRQVPQDVSAWLHIGADSVVTVYTGKVEVGQNVRTSLSQAVADELRTPIERIQLVMADTQLVPYDGGTSGSRSTPAMAPQLRRAAAAAREALLSLAAERYSLSRASLSVREGAVHDGQSNKTYSFGDLTKGEQLVKVLDRDAPITPADEWQVAGTSVPKVNGRAFVTGQHQYTSDIRREGMLFGKVLRPASFKATLTSVDTSRAEALPNVTVVHDGDFVGVVAPSRDTAEQALAIIDAQWKETPQPSSKELFAYLKEHPTNGRGGPGGSSDAKPANLADAFSRAEHQVSASYDIAYIAHAPLEPRAAVAEWNDNKLTVWTGTQQPFGVRESLATTFKLAPEDVRLIVPDTGAGYGGKHTGDAAIEAARLARKAGKPVKIIWTREEEFTWAYFRPAGVIEIKAGVQADGQIIAWEHHNWNSGASGLESPYQAPQQNQFHGADSPLRQGSYRGLAATANHFARESHMDDLAAAVKLEPLAFRLKNTTDPRLRAVLESAAEQFGWSGSKSTSTQGFGIAGGKEKGSYVASCAEVSIDADGAIKVVRLVTAFECGAVVNPDHLRNQIEGAGVQGIGGALFEAIQFADGRILNPRFSKYRVPRFADLPIQETVLIDRRDLPSAGAGETPIVCVAPAIGNAIFAATGVRLRNLPMAPDGLKRAAKDA